MARRAGTPYSGQAKFTERFRRPMFGKLEIDVTVEDAKAFTKPVTVRINQRVWRTRSRSSSSATRTSSSGGARKPSTCRRRLRARRYEAWGSRYGSVVRRGSGASGS